MHAVIGAFREGIAIRSQGVKEGHRSRAAHEALRSQTHSCSEELRRFLPQDTPEMPAIQSKTHQIELQSINRLVNIPIVESGWNYAETFYNRVKKSHNLIYWTFAQAESSFQTVVDTALPAVILFEKPIHTLDVILCKSLDVVEQRVPTINLPPQMMYWNTKQYVTDVGNKILKRADSVKQIGNSVLASKYTAFAADTLDGALTVADKYVDKYLPADGLDEQGVDEVDSKIVEGPAGKAIQTIQHVNRLSRKMQRRLTRRTLLEAKALKERSAETIHVLVYVAELIATDPKLAWQEGRKLWDNLSRDEPENQARPNNLEELIVLLTRESARRVVHLVNYTISKIAKVPGRVSNTILTITNSYLQLVDSLIKMVSRPQRENNVQIASNAILSNALRIHMIITVHLEGIREVVLDAFKLRVHKFALLLKEVNIYASDLLESWAKALQAELEQQQKHLQQQQVQQQPPQQIAVAKTPQQTRYNYQIKVTSDTLKPPASPKQYRAVNTVVTSNTNSNTSPTTAAAPANSNVVNGVEATS